MWTRLPDTGPQPGTYQSVLLLQAITETGLRSDPQLALETRRRIRNFADAQWQDIDEINFHAISLHPRAKYLLGAGFGLTEFLIAPVPNVGAQHGRFCSLGAIVNLMVVVCDRLLDSGSAPDEILPPAEIAAGGGESSPVMLVLREYFRRLESGVADEQLLHTVRKIVRRMFQAERCTVCRDCPLPYGFWIRKSALPFVLMALPAWSACTPRSPDLYFRHIRWLYHVGRFLGAVDDAVDFLEDSSSGHPNCWQAWRPELYPAAAQRVAGWGKRILDEWDSLVPRTSESDLLRETFLYNVWEWLRPAISAHAKR